MKTDFSQIWPFLIAALAVLMIYRRFRRNFGQQPLLRIDGILRLLLQRGAVEIKTSLCGKNQLRPDASAR
jgi:hypothetical protein